MAMQKKNILFDFMSNPDYIPSNSQLIVKYLTGKGNNLHEVESPSFSPSEPSSVFLVSMPKKYRQLVWLRKGDCIVIDPIAEGKKVLGEIICVLPSKSVLSLIDTEIWPKVNDENQCSTKAHLLKFFGSGVAKNGKNDSKSPLSMSPSSSCTSSDSETEDSESDSKGTNSEDDEVLASESDAIPVL